MGLFFELIRVALDNVSCLSRSPSESEWGILYALAKKQSLVGVCFAGVQKLQVQQQSPPEMLYLQWMGMAAKIQQRNEVVNRQCADLQNRLADCGFRNCILKGQGVAALYRVGSRCSDSLNGLSSSSSMNEGSQTPLNSSNTSNLSNLRQSGDIDVWIEGGLDATLALCKKLGQKADVTEQHVHLHMFHDTEVEGHYVPTRVMNPLVDKKLQRWIDSQQERQFANRDANGLCTPTAEFNLVYLLVHLYRHLFHEGVGLRQVMDYYFVLKSSTVADRKNAIQTIRELGLENFAGGVMYVLRVVFGSIDDLVICPQNDRHGKFLLNEIMLSGNMGHSDERLAGMDRSSGFKRFWLVTCHNMRLLTYYPAEVLWGPIARISLWIWRTKNGYRK